MPINILDDYSNCCGCAGCADICPKKCIEMKDDFYGAHPVINFEKCIDCNKCVTVCPMNKFPKFNDGCLQKLYSVVGNKNDVFNGSSGGAFGIIASYFQKNGYYICGAMFDEKLKVRHRLFEPNENISALKKSKYVQSNTLGIYSSIKKLLNDNKGVVFTGTPCQVSALRNYLNKDYENLFCIDIICHGVPSQKIFDEYILNIQNNKKIKVLKFSFRDKKNKYHHPHGFSYSYEKNKKIKEYHGIYLNSTYYTAFENYSIFRESCYSCKYAKIERYSDITLGDFWGIEKYDKSLDSNKGVSMVIVNTKKGLELFNALNLNAKEYSIEIGKQNNECLNKPTTKPYNYDKIKLSMITDGYDVTSKKYFGSNHKFLKLLYYSLPLWIRKIIRRSM